MFEKTIYFSFGLGLLKMQYLITAISFPFLLAAYVGSESAKASLKVKEKI